MTSRVLLREYLSYCVISYAMGKTLFHEILKPKIILHFLISVKRFAAASRHRRDSSRAYWLPCSKSSSLSGEALRDVMTNEGTSRPYRHVPPERAWSRPINKLDRLLYTDFPTLKRTSAYSKHGKIRSTRSLSRENRGYVSNRVRSLTRVSLVLRNILRYGEHSVTRRADRDPTPTSQGPRPGAHIVHNHRE